MKKVAIILFLTSCIIFSSGWNFANATHFRYGQSIIWDGEAGSNTVEFKIHNVWRRSAYSTLNGRCIDPGTGSSVACSGADGFADVGDIILELQGYTMFSPGDGTSIGSDLGPLMYYVDASDPDLNWVAGWALDPASFPSVDTTISHTYPLQTRYTATIDSCCRISPSVFPNRHINNPDGGYRLETIVNVGTGNHTPVSDLPAIVTCPYDSECSFIVPGADEDGDILNFRLSTSAEAGGGLYQAFYQPVGASIDPVTGIYTLDTTGLVDPSLYPDWNILYSTQVTIEEYIGNDLNGKTPVDFFIQIVPDIGDPPEITNNTPVCNTTIPAFVGSAVTFDVIASDPDVGQTLTLNVASMPLGASTFPVLPITGPGDGALSATFDWSPAAYDIGTHVITFMVRDNIGKQALCSTTIDVSENICGDLDGDGDVDADDRNLLRGSLRSTTGDAAFIPEADYDADGVISFGDYREWYECYLEYTNPD